MPQGYRLHLSVNGTPVQFQNVDVDIDGDNLETSTSIITDDAGNFLSYNDGFSDRDGDLRTLTMRVDTIVKDANVLLQMKVFEPKFKYTTGTYSLAYTNVSTTYTVAGTGYYVENISITSRVPGEARVRFTLTSLQTGYTIT